MKSQDKSLLQNEDHVNFDDNVFENKEALDDALR